MIDERLEAREESIRDRTCELMQRFPFYGEARARALAEEEQHMRDRYCDGYDGSAK